MRILRGKSNLEVSSQGFALFVVGLIIATFIGGAVRTILSSEKVHDRIVSELKSRFPRHEFQIGSTEVLLSRGVWPGLGLRLRNVNFKQDVCGKLSFVLQIPQAVLPVDLLSIRHGRVRLGAVEMTDAKMHLDYRECSEARASGQIAAAAAAPAASSTSPQSSLRSTVAEKGIRPPDLDWREASKALERLRLENMELTYERNRTWKVILKSAEFRLSGNMHLQASVDVQKSLPFGSLSHAVEVEATGENHGLEWAMQSDFKEGRIKWNGEWDFSANTAQTDVQLVQLPLKDLSSELFQMGFAEREVKLKTAWLTCQAGWEGSLARFEEQPVKVHTCKLEGAYGRVDLESAEVFPSSNPPLKEPARFHVQKLQMQPLIESLGRQVLPAVLARLGVWSGVVVYGSESSWNLDGFLENAEVVFSNQSVRGKQLIRSAHTQAAREARDIHALVNGVQLQDGEFTGQVELRLSDDGRTGSFKVQVERLGLSPAIQNVLIGGHMSPLKLSGEGWLQNGELSRWNGTLSASELQGEGWRGEGLDIRSRFVSPSAFHVEAKAARLSADTQWRFYPQLRVARADLGIGILWRDVNARLEITKSGGTITGLSATEVDKGVSWRAKGAWVREGEMSATVLIGGAHPQSIALRGEKGTINVQDKPGDSPQGP